MAWTERFISRLRRTLERRGQSRHDAEDLIQEAFLRYEMSERKADVTQPEAFVARIAFNLSIDERRRRARRPVFVPIEDARAIQNPIGTSEDLDARDRPRRLAKGLDALGADARRTLMAQRLDGLSCADIAAQDGVSVSAIEKRIARSILFLMEWMEQ